MEGEPFPRPPSSGTSPPPLSDCIQHLLKFILSSSIDQTPDFDLYLSNHYCSHLLKLDPNPDLAVDTSDGGGGVPVYPLYKCLASALHHLITSGRSFFRPSFPFKENESLKEKKDGWNQMVFDKGFKLVEMLNAVEFEIDVQEPYFSQLRVGLKTVEGRCALGDYNRIRPGALLLFNKCLLLEAQDVKWYASFSDMLETEGLQSALPGAKSIAEGVQIYRRFYTEEKENINGVIAICVSKPVSQPYITLSSIVSGLSYEGIGSLLGLVHTTGTVPDALPPPRSALLSSFLVPHKPNVHGSTLSEGARALAKHVNRASSGWWGGFDGNDANKNEFASRVVSELLSHCCWMNIHVVPPHGDILEIRVAEGYGARWTKDGSKFIGFVEPYMDDGHYKGWKH